MYIVNDVNRFFLVEIKRGRILVQYWKSALLYNSLSVHYLVIIYAKQIDLNTLGIFIPWPVNFLTGYIWSYLNIVLHLRIEASGSRPELFSCLPRWYTCVAWRKKWLCLSSVSETGTRSWCCSDLWMLNRIWCIAATGPPWLDIACFKLLPQ